MKEFDHMEEEDDEEEAGHSPLLIIFIVLFSLALIAAAYWFIAPNFTGYVVSSFDYLKLNTTITGDSSFSFGSRQNEPFLLRSLKITGKVIGNGSVDVILNDGDNDYTVYSSALKERPMGGVTGFSVYPSGSGIAIDTQNTKVSGLGQNIISGIYILNLDENKDVSIERIRLVTNEATQKKIQSIKVLGDETIQASKGEAFTGQIIDIKDFTISKSGEYLIEEITFDTSIQNLIVEIEVFYRPYKALFILGDEQMAKITVDLSGKTLANANLSEIRTEKQSSIIGIDTSGTLIESDTLKNIVLVNNHRDQALSIEAIALIWEPYSDEKITEVAGYKQTIFKSIPGTKIGEKIQGFNILVNPKETGYIDAVKFDHLIESKTFKISLYFSDGSSKAFDFVVGGKSREIADLDNVFGKYQPPPEEQTDKPNDANAQAQAMDAKDLEQALQAIDGLNLIGTIIPSAATSEEKELPDLTFSYKGGNIPFTAKTQEQLQWVEKIRGDPKIAIRAVQSECVDTCAFSVALQKSTYIVRFKVSPGTVFELEGIYFDGEKIA